MQGLAEKVIPDSAGRMGRPPLGNKATQVRLPETVMAQIDALTGRNQRAKFIREAVIEKLARERKS